MVTGYHMTPPKPALALPQDVNDEEVSGKISLTKLWDYVIRTRCLPESLDLDALFETIHGRLRSPEWEVRQNALRVLADIIPLVSADCLDTKMALVQADLVNNLGHLGPAVRKGAVDALRTYLNFSTIPNAITRDLVERGVEKYGDRKIPTNVVLGIIICLPYVINNKLNDTTVNYIIHKLLDKIVLVIHQETVLRALLRIRNLIGVAKFDAALSTHESYNSKRDFELLCEVYDLQIYHPHCLANFTVAKSEDVSDSDNGPPPNFDFDKVILETEIHLDSGSSITMKIHEENSLCEGLSPASNRSNTKTFKVLPDVSIDDNFELVRQTPRRVHFGGEIVKMRTPDSDSNLEDNDATISIISDGDGDKPVIEIKYVESETKTTTRTSRSLIPIPIKHTQSAPSSPTGQRFQHVPRTLENSKEFKSSPSLSSNVSPTWGKSRIPRRLNTEVKRNIETKILINIKEPLKDSLNPNKADEDNAIKKSKRRQVKRIQNVQLTESDTPTNNQPKIANEKNKKPSNRNTLRIPIAHPRRSNREEVLSPRPIHNQIELFHNLTRTPSPKLKESPEPPSSPTINQLPSETQSQVQAEVEGVSTPSPIVNHPDKESLETESQEHIANASDAKVSEQFAFHIYTSMETHSEDGLRDSPIPVNNSGDCLTCSSSGSETGVHIERFHIANLDDTIIEDLQNVDDIKVRQRGLLELVKVIQTPSVLASIQDRLPSMFYILFSALQHTALHNSADSALTAIFSNMNQDVLQIRLQQICLHLAKLGSPSGIRLAIVLMRRIQPKLVVDQLLAESIIRAKSAKVREGALQIVMAISRLYPSTDLDLPRPLKVVIRSLSDKKRRVRQAALETLAALAQITGNTNILEAAGDITADLEAPERHQILQVIRTRLSRKQLPTVHLNGNVQYTVPMGESEIEWLSKGYSASSSPGTPVNETKNQSICTEGSMSDHSGHTTQQDHVQEAFRERFVENYSPRASTAKGQNQKINYWKTNARNQNQLYGQHQPFSGDEAGSEWSESNREEPFSDQNGNRSQLWAIDPTAFTTMGSVKLSTANGTLRQVYVMQNGNAMKSASTNTEQSRGKDVTTPLIHRKVNRRSMRGRSFSPPVRASQTHEPFPEKEMAHAYRSQERFVSGGHYHRNFGKTEPEVIRKSFSSEQITGFQRFRNENTFSSGSSSSKSSSTQHGGGIWREWRTGIPMPIFDGKIKLRTRPCGSNPKPKGPMTIPYYPIIKSPCPSDSPERRNSSSANRAQFSSGSESSGYFTPPPEPQEARISPTVITPQQSPTSSAQSERFVRIATPRKLDSDQDSFEDEDVPQETVVEGTSNASETLNEFRASSSLTSLNCVERSLRKNDATNSLDFAKVSFDDIDGVAHQIDVQIATHIQRKSVNSAPALNEMASERSSPVRASLPGSCGESLDEPGLPEVLYASTSPPKQSPVKVANTVKPIALRRKSSKCGATKGSEGNNDRPFTKPREALHDISAQLESTDWETTMKGLQGLVRLIRHHRDVVEGQMHAVCALLGKHIRNLRSQVARNACYAAGELFRASKRPLEMELDELATPLLHRTADTNKFLRSDANAALDEMCLNLSVPKLVSVIAYRGCTHHNSVVRSAAARLLCNIVQRLGAEKAFQLPRDTRDKILLAGANGLTEGSLDTRQHAKMLLGLLAEHCMFQKAMTEAVPGSVLRHIDKTMRMLMK